ncbi:single-stranded-DNA-specific exonuclease RecJ [Reinekea blandensis]|uniref:Single-stranded-DNA-specific exonuclease RecJ n=1 Tax=Reinekea blandensis MED297 TaxID=314283 RepID=A4BBM4_9GAMM|nr:single-stranded-DNA-specific exonuclease RecJ [Reinekea blandensis]EAR10359.1 single-stranded-DNA-specific exonuclease RecJ [Reinekea sp. MED297] [Reinekea blandensis MED297]
MADPQTPISVAGFDIRTRPAHSLSKSLHPNPLVDRLYRARQVTDPQELEPSLRHLVDYRLLKGLTEAVSLLNRARSERWRVLVVGDYDTDGATSTALAVLGLQSFGLDVDYLLPNRFEYGYGLSAEIVDLALTRQPDLIVTVDNGIASIEGVERANAAGVKVLVTDHHLAGAELPQAAAIVNPNQPDCAFPSKAACGCTVLYYVLIALRAELRAQGQPDLPNLGQWLDLVALATVADVVPLDENNRRLVTHGLNRVRAGQCRPGIRALFEVAGRQWQEAKASDFGFVIGPRLNAAGRLDDMTIGVQLLLAESDDEARSLASELHALNTERRQIEQSMVADVSKSLPDLSRTDKRCGIVVTGNDWHEGVIGIVASRVKDRIHKPVVAFAAGDNGQWKGSARSVPGVHMRDALDWVAKKSEGVVLKFGGHAMAAGLTIAADRSDEFADLFDQAVQALAESEALTPHLWCDGALSDSELTLDNALALEQAGPWGQAFPEPLFYGEFQISDRRVLADRHLKMTLQQGAGEWPAIAFNVEPSILNASATRVHGLYQLSVNRFRGQVSVQLIFNKLELG